MLLEMDQQGGMMSGQFVAASPQHFYTAPSPTQPVYSPSPVTYPQTNPSPTVNYNYSFLTGSNSQTCLFSTGGLDGGGPGGGAFATATTGADLPDTKEGIEELCPVCGDKVSGYHYGLLTCESCKGFFKRTVQNKKVYTCVADRSCHIDKTQRKRCPFCRFQKCLEVGMKLEAVRADRMRGGRNKFGPMYKRDRARKMQLMRQRQMAIQTLRGSAGGADYGTSADFQAYSPQIIKQEIQIPQVSSLTSSPDSSPSSLGTVGTLGEAAAQWHRQDASPGKSAGPGATAYLTAELAGPERPDPITAAPPPQTTNKVSPVIRDLVNALDDREWQSALYSLLQNQTYNQCEVDLFELLCKVLDQNLFSQVDWARNSAFFKDLKVDDQMKLLQHSWSDMLVLDHMHQRMHNSLPDETTLPNGQKFDLLCLGLLGLPSLAEMFNEITAKLADLKFDVTDYICLKFLLLLNPDVRGLMNRKHVQEGHEQLQIALSDYCRNSYPHVQEKFNKLLQIMPEIHSLARNGEESLYLKHCSGGAPTQTLLMEMLHAKRK